MIGFVIVLIVFFAIYAFTSVKVISQLLKQNEAKDRRIQEISAYINLRFIPTDRAKRVT